MNDWITSILFFIAGAVMVYGIMSEDRKEIIVHQNKMVNGVKKRVPVLECYKI